MVGEVKRHRFSSFLYSISDDALVYFCAFLGVMSIRILPLLVSVLNGAIKVDLSGFTTLYFIAVAIAAVIAMINVYLQERRGMAENDPEKLKANRTAKAQRIKGRCWAAFLQGAGILGLLSTIGGGN